LLSADWLCLEKTESWNNGILEKDKFLLLAKLQIVSLHHFIMPIQKSGMNF